LFVFVSVAEYEAEFKDMLYGPEKGKVFIVKAQL